MQITCALSLVVSCLIASSSAALYIGYYNDTSAPGKCVLKEFDIILAPGDIVQDPLGCGRLLCYEQGEVEGQTCGVIGPPPGCILGKPLKPNDPYPDCCWREYICNNVQANK